MASLPAQPLTEEEYLRLERAAEIKSEYHDGQMFPMSGGSLHHSLVATKVAALLDRLVPAGCRVLTSDMRIKIAASGTYTYPDCAVVCGEPELARISSGASGPPSR